MAVGDPKITRLLEHPAIWRGRSAARRTGLSTGFAALDAHLPDRGWPRTGLTEILVSRFGSGELTVLMPALAMLTRAVAARWCVWVAPPFVPFAPALAARGVLLDRVAVVAGARPSDPRTTADPCLWAFEQTLGSGACDAVLGWMRRVRSRDIRRLQLAAERGRTLGVLFRPRTAAREASMAVLRLGVEPLPGGVRLTLLKGRSAQRGVLDLRWAGSVPDPGGCGS
ncbi:MAG TPA: translesion DNA synthesis-associated protein ImuA [Steroidobacteraceae bacterium]|nr:translesion DNA synthesis-associated protein ImuA [Steroidobacteraceae bacterium]